MVYTRLEFIREPDHAAYADLAELGELPLLLMLYLSFGLHRLGAAGKGDKKGVLPDLDALLMAQDGQRFSLGGRLELEPTIGPALLRAYRPALGERPDAGGFYASTAVDLNANALASEWAENI
jgi:hypothetical protein